MKVKFTNLYNLIPNKKKVINKINLFVKKANFIAGSEVQNFENNFAKFTGAKYCVTVANGTDALEIAVKALNLKKNSEIIVPVNTWISTAESVVSNGHKIVFCDVNLDDYTLCVNDLKKKINKKTKAIIAVHLYGNPSNMNEIKAIIKNKNIKIVEDCAQAHGSKINGKHVGNFGDFGTFSFFPAKNLGAFGAIITNSKYLFNISKRLSNHGALKKYDHKFPGRNSRLDAIQSAILNIKLNDYKNVLKTRNNLASIYSKGLKNINGLNTYKYNKNNYYSFHQYVIRTNKRDKLRKYLSNNKIDTMIHYPYMLNQLKFFPNKKLKNSNLLGKKILSLPISEDHTKKEIQFVCKKISSFFKG